MTDAPRPTRAKHSERAAREERLARALRDNLRRRKEQARAREAGPAECEQKQPEDGETPA